MLESLAEAAQEIYCEGQRANGFKYGPKTDQVLKTNNALVPFAELAEDLKEANRLNVRDIPGKLEVAGYIMVPARSNEPPFNFPGEPLEMLAETEHERWMQFKLVEGWKYASKTDNVKKMHNCLVPWDKLPNLEKDKDRDLVRGIPMILARAGYAIVKANS
jgi:hypothetical protein